MRHAVQDGALTESQPISSASLAELDIWLAVLALDAMILSQSIASFLNFACIALQGGTCCSEQQVC